MSPEFKTKKLQMETLGEYLRDTRTSSDLSYEKVQRLTQIPVKYLEALEQGNFSTLPADVYVKGFLKSLAAVYHVSVEVLLDQFERERGLARSLKNDSISPQPSRRFSIPRFSITPKTFTIVLVVLVAVLSLGYLGWQLLSVSAPPPLSILYPDGDFTINTRSILLRGQTEPGARVYVNGQEVTVGDGGIFQEVLTLTEGSNKIVVKSLNQFGHSAEVSRTIAVSPSGAESTTTPQLVGGKISVAISIGPESTWVEVKVDGAVVQQGIAAAGQELTFSADKELLLTTGNAGSTRVSYNGRDLGILGKPGEVLSNIRFTP